MNSEERVPVSVVIEESLLAQLDAKAKSEDMNRSQFLRKLVRENLAKDVMRPAREEVAA
jgi:metal-responsive CopG/Arc/MetJ family transcriptional regulator